MGIFIKIELIEMNYRIKRLFDKVDKYAEKASAFCLWNFCSANLLGSFFDPISELKLALFASRLSKPPSCKFFPLGPPASTYWLFTYVGAVQHCSIRHHCYQKIRAAHHYYQGTKNQHLISFPRPSPPQPFVLRHQEQDLCAWLLRCSRWQMWSSTQIRPKARCCGFRRSLPLHEMTLPRESRRQRRPPLRGFEVHWDQ